MGVGCFPNTALAKVRRLLRPNVVAGVLFQTPGGDITAADRVLVERLPGN
jgi:hypothetical protein